MQEFNQNTFDFEIYVNIGRKTFHMEVYHIYQGDSIERFKVKGGSRYIVLESNRPFLKVNNKRESINWKLKEGDMSGTDPKQAAEALLQIIEAIEHYIKDEPVTFEQVRQMKKG